MREILLTLAAALGGYLGEALAAATAVVDTIFLKHRPRLRVVPYQVPNCRFVVYVGHVVRLSSASDAA